MSAYRLPPGMRPPHAGLGPIVNAGAAPWRLPGFAAGPRGPGGMPMMWRPPPGGFAPGHMPLPPPGSAGAVNGMPMTVRLYKYLFLECL